MKRFLGLKKKKVKNDADLSYRPPDFNGNGGGGGIQSQQQHAHHQRHGLGGNSGNNNNNNEGASSDAGQLDVTSGYRYALTAYADTIDPAFSNEDGMGGGGGTLRSRSGRVRGSAGTKHKGSLIPLFEDYHQNKNNNNNDESPIRRRGDGGESGIDGRSPITRTSSAALRQEHYDAYERIMGGVSGSTSTSTATDTAAQNSPSWTPIPEQPRDVDSGDSGEQQNNDNQQLQRQHNQQNNLSASNRTSTTGPSVSFQNVPAAIPSSGSNATQIAIDSATHTSSATSSQHNNDNIMTQSTTLSELSSNNLQQPQQQQQQQQSYLNNSSRSRTSQQRQTHHHHQYSNKDNPSITQAQPPSSFSNNNNNKSKQHGEQKITIEQQLQIILQPDAIYEEHYGDAYVDSLIKYLYPAGYQSMRPRSGPWKLSIFIFLLFLWLSVFIVGHCYDRGQREYNSYYNQDDAYLTDVDDDTLVMETRWCGSKPLYLMWLVCVWITVLSMSYCSIIGYVKVRDVAVANGRSQPSGMGINTSYGRSDYYVMVDNVAGGGGGNNGGPNVKQSTDGGGGGSGGGADNVSEVSSSATTTNYSSYQDGGKNHRYAPSIYQSDGTPQFWGGHIYRPTQAAVAMTNRP